MAGIDLYSRSFGEHQPIPVRHAKDHDNLPRPWRVQSAARPPSWPRCARSQTPHTAPHPLVLTGLPPTATGLVEHQASAVEGCNDFGEEGYGGPLPPVGDEPHRYFFGIRHLGAA